MTHEDTSAFYFFLQLNSFPLDASIDTKFCPVYTLPSQVSLSVLDRQNRVILVHGFRLTIISVTALSVSVICFVGAVKDSSSGVIGSGTGCM